MIVILRGMIYLILGLPLFMLLVHTTVRAVRHLYKFPMPQYFANLIDNPIRRRIQPPDETAIRHGIKPGMTILEVGPGNGTYTIAAARRVGDKGKLVTIDIEPKMIQRVEHRAQAEGIKNIDARVASVYDLPFEDETFDLIYMIAVIGEIPDAEKAMKEFYRVLSPSGTLVFSELISDPDYPRAKSLIQKAKTAGFRLKDKIGSFIYYTLIFEKEMNQNGWLR
jgi:ubiquinone/menaquinone biosynthesis C-methylase UbiE